MGWKTVKEHFGIDSIVSVGIPASGEEPSTMYVGGGYLTELVEIDMRTGKAMIKPGFESISTDEYKDLLHATPELLLELINKEDEFERSLPVYSEVHGEVREFYCEALGWPNTTHEGYLMFENTFFPDRKSCLEYVVEDAETCIVFTKRQIQELEVRVKDAKDFLERSEQRLRRYTAELASLE